MVATCSGRLTFRPIATLGEARNGEPPFALRLRTGRPPYTKPEPPVVDIIWFHEDYLKLFAASDLELVAHHTPLGRKDDPCDWLTETSIAPWVIYVLKRK